MNETNETRTVEEIAAARAELERKSTGELFAVTLDGEEDDDAPWKPSLSCDCEGLRRYLT
jgi:hypothetical protein